MPIRGNSAIGIDVQVMTSSGEYVTLKMLSPFELGPTVDDEIGRYVNDEILSGEFQIACPTISSALSRAEARCPKKKMRKLRRIKRRMRRQMIRIMKDVERGNYGIF